MDIPNTLNPPEDAAIQSTSAASSRATAKGAANHQPAPPKIRRRNRLITSCLECRRRKLKCDKLHPCTNCTKFARDCLFLAPALDPAAQLKLAEIKEKMGSLEKTLEEDVARRRSGSVFRSSEGVPLPGLGDGYSSDEPPAAEDEKDLEPSHLATEDAAYSEDADDDLMDLGIKLGKMRITDRIGGLVRPKLAEELSFAVKEVPEPQDPPSNASTQSLPIYAQRGYLGPGPDFVAPSSSFFFAPEPRKVSILHYLPSKSAADKLVKQYWDAVHYMARIVHRPSFERQYNSFWREISAGADPPKSFQAVLLAALLSAAISMPEDAVSREFGVAKSELVDNFRTGTETALSLANFLRTTKLETLQAFVMYLIPLCRSEVSRAHSALTGTAIRLAECMGLHRDGTHYGLGPVEVHVRRLIWYQVCFLDVRTCEATGPRPQIRKEDFDTRFPLNVNDVDLESANPPTLDSDQWTDMTFTRMRFECNEMHRLIWNERVRLERKTTSLTHVLAKVQNFWTAMEKKYRPMLDKNNPFHQMGLLTYKVLTFRMHVMVLHRYASDAARLMPERLRQILLNSGTEQVEAAMAIETTPALQKWAWYSGAFHQYHTSILLLSETYATPIRYNLDSVWRCLDYTFELPASMSHLDKVRIILSELKNRAEVYQSFRKMRAPTVMKDGVGPRPVIRGPPVSSGSTASQSQGQGQGQSQPTTWRGDPAQPAAISKPPSLLHSDSFAEASTALWGGPGGILSGGAQFNFNGVANGEALYAPPVQASPQSSSDTNSSVNFGGFGADAGAAIGLGEVSNDPMLDIDWNEWDKMFPPDINTGDLNFPDFNFSSGFQ